MKKLKADCTPEEWAKHLNYHRERRLAKLEEERAKRREYSSRPEVKARRKAYDQKPEVLERKRARSASQEGKLVDRARRAARKLEDPEGYQRRLALQRERRTGFPAGVYATLLEHQQGKCAICQRTFGPGARLCGDHCHDSQQPRGLLCHHCNTVEGMLKHIGLDPVVFAQRLVGYLTKPPAALVRQPSLPL